MTIPGVIKRSKYRNVELFRRYSYAWSHVALDLKDILCKCDFSCQSHGHDDKSGPGGEAWGGVVI